MPNLPPVTQSLVMRIRDKKFKQDLKTAEQSYKTFTNNTGKEIFNLATRGRLAFTGLTSAILIAGHTLAEQSRTIVSHAQAVGTGVRQYEAFSDALASVGADLTLGEDVIRTWGERLEDIRDGSGDLILQLGKLKRTLADFEGLTPLQALDELFTALQETGDAQQFFSIGSIILGDNIRFLSALANSGVTSLSAYTNQMIELGATLSGEVREGIVGLATAVRVTTDVLLNSLVEGFIGAFDLDLSQYRNIPKFLEDMGDRLVIVRDLLRAIGNLLPSLVALAGARIALGFIGPAIFRIVTNIRLLGTTLLASAGYFTAWFIAFKVLRGESAELLQIWNKLRDAVARGFTKDINRVSNLIYRAFGGLSDEEIDTRRLFQTDNIIKTQEILSDVADGYDRIGESFETISNATNNFNAGVEKTRQQSNRAGQEINQQLIASISSVSSGVQTLNNRYEEWRTSLNKVNTANNNFNKGVAKTVVLTKDVGTSLVDGFKEFFDLSAPVTNNITQMNDAITSLSTLDVGSNLKRSFEELSEGISSAAEQMTGLLGASLATLVALGIIFPKFGLAFVTLAGIFGLFENTLKEAASTLSGVFKDAIAELTAGVSDVNEELDKGGTLANKFNSRLDKLLDNKRLQDFYRIFGREGIASGGINTDNIVPDLEQLRGLSRLDRLSLGATPETAALFTGQQRASEELIQAMARSDNTFEGLQRASQNLTNGIKDLDITLTRADFINRLREAGTQTDTPADFQNQLDNFAANNPSNLGQGGFGPNTTAAVTFDQSTYYEVVTAFTENLQQALVTQIQQGDWVNVGVTLVNVLAGTLQQAVLDDLSEYIGDKFKDFTKGFAKAAGGSGNLFQDLENFFSGGFNKIGSTIQKVGSTLFETVGKLFSGLFDAVGGFLSGLGGGGGGLSGLFAFHEGGVVPGYPGQEVPAILQAGETVLPTQDGVGLGGLGTTVVEVNITGDVSEQTQRWFLENQEAVAAGVQNRFVEDRVLAPS